MGNSRILLWVPVGIFILSAVKKWFVLVGIGLICLIEIFSNYRNFLSQTRRIRPEYIKSKHWNVWIQVIAVLHQKKQEAKYQKHFLKNSLIQNTWTKQMSPCLYLHHFAQQIFACPSSEGNAKKNLSLIPYKGNMKTCLDLKKYNIFLTHLLLSFTLSTFLLEFLPSTSYINISPISNVRVLNKFIVTTTIKDFKNMFFYF